ncbi:MAG: T9SS type A sorting domain-containing protein [Bacteroidota bacterium]
MMNHQPVPSRAFYLSQKVAFVLLIFLAIFMVNNVTFAQVPSGSASTPEKANFYQIQKNFNDSWKGRKITKGAGYMPFKHWEWFWEPRVNRDGTFPPNNVVVKEWERFASEDAASSTSGNWVPIGPDKKRTADERYVGLGRVNCIAFHPTDTNTFWVGTPSGGLWRTNDFGKTWSTRFDYQPVIGVSDIVIDKKSPNIMYVATGDYDGSSIGSISGLNGMYGGDTKSIGVLKSTDGGQSWRSTTFNMTASMETLISRLIAHPAGADTLYATTSSEIFKTTNGGDSWDTIRPDKLKEISYSDIVFKPGSNSVLYAASRSKSITTVTPPVDYWASIYRSEDNGKNWIRIKECKNVTRIKLAVSEQEPGILEALCVLQERNGLSSIQRFNFDVTPFTSENLVTIKKGCSNNYLNSYIDPHTLDSASVGSPCSGQGEYDLCYLINPSNKDERWLGGVNTWKSPDRGNTFTITNYWQQKIGDVEMAHADKHWFAFHPLQKETFFECNDGGVLYSKNGGKTWTDITDGMQIGQIYRLAGAWENDSLLLAGFQDNGSQVRQEPGDWWFTNAIGGDGFECMIDWCDPLVRYVTYLSGDINRTRKGDWSDNVKISDNIPDANKSAAIVIPLIQHPENPKTIYIGYNKIWKSINQGDKSSFTAIMTHPKGEKDTTFRVLAISQYDPKVMWAATGSRLYKTENEWTKWDTIKRYILGAIGKYTITGIAIHPTKPNTVFVAFSGYDTLKVYRTDNGGVSWSNISGKSLPRVPVNCIAYEDFTNDALYIGTDVGVFYRNAGMPDWIPFTNNLPNVMVTDLEIAYGVGKIRASTFGRGVWESDLYVTPGTYKVNVKDVPKQGGDVEGGGSFKPGAKATLTAKPESGYIFAGWYENGMKVNDSLTYDFTVNENHNIVGKFSNPSSVEYKLKSRIQLFPNPTKGVVEIKMDKELRDEIQTIRAITMQGALVYESSAKTDDDHISIDLSARPDGLYIITFYFKSGEKVSYMVMLTK